MSRTVAVGRPCLWKRVQPQVLKGSARRWALSLVAAVLLCATASGQELLVDEAISIWDHGGGFIAWSFACHPDGPGYLRRLSNFAQRPETLQETALPCSGETPWGLTVDASGLYYFAPHRRQLIRRPPDRGDVEEVVFQFSASSTPSLPALMDSNDTHLFWVANNRLLRVDKQGADGAAMLSRTRRSTALVATNTDVFWMDAGGLWHLEANCVDTPNRCSPRSLTPSTGELLWVDDDHLYWIDNDAKLSRIRRLQLPAGRVETLYRASDTRWRLSQPVSDGSHLFWKEHRLDVQGRARLLKLPLDDLSRRPIELVGGLNAGGTKMAIDDRGIYFTGQNRQLFRLAVDAPDVTRDLEATAMEVTQGIQNLDNDVQLAAGKATFVRLFGRLADGPDAYAVNAGLQGTRGGNPLPGSPLKPLNGPLIMRPEDVLLRGMTDGGWLFELPEAWISAGRIELEGVIDPESHYPDLRRGNNRISENLLFKEHPPTCAVFVPIRGHGPEAKNNYSQFYAARRLASRLLPSPGFLHTTHDSQLEELEACWFGFLPYPCLGPYEMGGDPTKVILALALRAAHSDDPDSCEEAGAWVQYVGMVHSEVFTGRGGRSGLCTPYSWFKLPSSRSLPQEPSWAWPPEGATLAHEMGHNFERYHVDCGDPTSVDSSYPYPPCQIECLPGDEGCPQDLADNLGRIHYGFDVSSQTVIAPDDAGDLMSYSDQVDLPRWTSDYTWNEIAIQQRSEGPEPSSCIADVILDQTASGGQTAGSKTAGSKTAGSKTASGRAGSRDDQDSQTSGTTVTRKPSAQGTKPEPLLPPGVKPASVPKPDLFHADDLRKAPRALLIGGSLSPRRGESVLRPAWIRNSSALGKGMMRRWQRQVTPAFKPGDKVLGQWRLRIHATDGTLMADRAVLPMGSGEPHASPDAKRYFLLAAPLPLRPVGHIELWNRDRKMARLQAGKTPPRVRILSPREGQRFDGPFTVQWRAEDKDPGDVLLFTVQYSHNGGKTWQAVVNDMPGHPEKKQHSVRVRGVPGSASQALVRVLVTDGLHTREATSQAFTVRDQAPKAYIDWPQEGVEVPAGRPIVVRGGGDDPERGEVPSKGLSWTLNGEAIGGGATARLEGGLAPGAYELELLARDLRGNGNRALQTLRIAPLDVPRGNGLELDGLCADAAYRGSPAIRLAPYDGAAGRDQASVRAVHRQGHLWLCFHNLLRTPRIVGRPSVSRVGVRLAVDGNDGPRLSHQDAGYFVREDGIPVSRRTGRDGRLSAPGPSALQAQVYRHSPRRWSAELRLDLSGLMPRKNELRLALRHENAGPGGRGSVAWPFEAKGLRPSTWAEARLTHQRLDAITDMKKPRPRRPVPGLKPDLITGPAPVQLQALVPSSAPTGRGPMTVEVRGRGFQRGMTVLWNGDVRPTRFLSSTRLIVQLGADDFQWGRRVGVTVMPGNTKGPGGQIPKPLQFDVERKKGTAGQR